MVYVLNKDKKPLMPCKEAKARHLLKDKKATIVKKIPFTIQLLFDCENNIQPINLGIDTGSKHIGVSATTKERVLFEADIELRNDIVELLATRKNARRVRRCQKVRHRKPRYNNRKKKDYEVPSIKNKIETHSYIINMIHTILPISNIYIELAKFDIEKIQNPTLYKQDYCNGVQKGFYNVREYILWRDKYICQYCKGKSNDKILNVHHIESRKTGGNAPNNLITLCKTCHNKFHKGIINLSIKRGNSFRDANFMNYLRTRIIESIKNDYPNLNITYGYLTKEIRLKNNLPKTHFIDARCINNNPNAISDNKVYYLKKVRRHNRRIYRDNILKGGIQKRNQCLYSMFGFHRYDIVKVDGEKGTYYINSLRTRGVFQLKSLINPNIEKDKTYRKIKKIQLRNGYIIECDNSNIKGGGFLNENIN